MMYDNDKKNMILFLR